MLLLTQLRLQERERRIFTATQLLGDTLAGTGFSHAIGWLSLLSSLGVTAQGILEMKGITFERRAFLAMGSSTCSHAVVAFCDDIAALFLICHAFLTSVSVDRGAAMTRTLLHHVLRFHVGQNYS